MKTLTRIPVLLFLFLLVTGCAVTHKYGPYMGKVVDRETKNPLEGVVIFVRFYTEGIYQLHHFVDAIETLTDGKGEFYISPQRLFTSPAPFERWQKEGDFIIFKPGYLVLNHVPENRYVTMELPRLKTWEERGRNVGDALSFSMSVPYEKYKLLLDAVNQERIELGGKPYTKPGVNQ